MDKSHLAIRPAKTFLAMFAVVTLTGCILRDSRVSHTVPLNIPLASFSGTYWSDASYVSTSRFWGLEMPNRINELVEFKKYIPYYGGIDRFRISTLTNGDISIEALKSSTLIARVTWKTNQDFTFDGGVINKKRKWGGGSYDSPGIVIGEGKDRLCLDEEKSLIVIQTGSMTGLIGVVPFFINSKGMSVFRRIQDGP